MNSLDDIRHTAEVMSDRYGAMDATESTVIGMATDTLRLLGAVDAIFGLHTPDDDGDCTYCADYFCDTRKAEYPCETVRTIEAALKGDRG